MNIDIVNNYIYLGIYLDSQIIYKNTYGKVTEYGQCPNTDTLGISETINPTKKLLMNKIFIIIKIV